LLTEVTVGPPGDGSANVTLRGTDGPKKQKYMFEEMELTAGSQEKTPLQSTL